MVGSKAAGPETETAMERFVTLFRLPYALTCVLLALLLGPPGAILAIYAESHDAGYSVTKGVLLFLGTPSTPAETALGLGLLVLALFYVLYGIKFMRSHISRAAPQLAHLMPAGEKDYRHAFRQVSSFWPPLILAGLLGGLIAIVADSQLSGFVSGPVSALYLIFAYPLWFMAVLTFAWVYVSAIRGLYELGKRPLVLKRFYEDRMLGLRPFGSLSLSFSLVYFAGLSIIAYPAVGSLVSAVVLLGFVGAGIAIFLLPLMEIHVKMRAQIELERNSVLQRFGRFVETSSDVTGAQSDATLADIRKELRSMMAVLTLDINRQEVDSIPEWPIDTHLLTQLAAILLGVMIVIFSKVLTDLLRI